MDRNRIVAGLDVHKDSVFLCIMQYDGAKIFEKTYGVLTTELRRMRDDMLSRGVTECAMESTSVYWLPIWNELYGHMTLRLANPLFIKQLPGRKNDTRDAQWISECQLKKLIRESFVPNPVVQDMRKLNRRISHLNEDLAYNKNRLDAALQGCGFRLSNYVSSTGGQSYRSVVRAISQGETDAGRLVSLVHGRTLNRHGRETIAGAVTGNFSDVDISLIRQYLAVTDMIEDQMEHCQRLLTAMCEEHFPEQYRRLQTIPGVKERAATALIAETGADMSTFAKATNLVGWCGLKPRNDESNRRIKCSRITHGNKYLRQILIETAWAASRTRNCFFSNFSHVQVTVKKKRKMKILVAIARKILVAVWHMLTKQQDFVDVYLRRLGQEHALRQQIKQIESTVAG